MRKENIGRIKISGISVQMLRFAYYIAVIAENDEDLNNMLKNMNET